MTTERAAVARPQLKGQHTPGESSEMAFSFPCFLFDVTKSFLFLNLSQVGRSQASDLAKQGVSGEFACSENPEAWGWRRGDWRQWCGECALERSACAGDTCLCVSSGPCPRPPPLSVSAGGQNMSLCGCGSRSGNLCSALEGTEGFPELSGHRLVTWSPSSTAAPANTPSSTPSATRAGHLASASPCRCGWPPRSARHSPEQPRLAHPCAGTPACSKGRRSLDGALAPSTGAFISGAPGSFW